MSLKRFQMGILFAREGQTDENDMFGNVGSSDNFDEFLGLVGHRIPLLGWDGYGPACVCCVCVCVFH